MHGNAPPTPEGRLRLCQRIESGWAVAAAAESMNISRQCAHKWWSRSRRNDQRDYMTARAARSGVRTGPGTRGASDRRVAALTQARTRPAQRDRRRAGVYRASRPGPQRSEPAAMAGPPDRAGDPADQDRPLR